MYQHLVRLLLGTVGLLALAAPVVAGAAGTPRYQARVTSYDFADSSGTPMAAIVHYPAMKSNGGALTTQKFPALVFMQGANVDAGRYGWLGDLAQYGYIVVLPD
jgi:hypothetical protein